MSDYFGGFMQQKCAEDDEFITKIKKFINILFLKKELLLRKIHHNSFINQIKLILIQWKEKKKLFI